MEYRPELDGVRTVAVLSVIAFHADERLVPGGYVGVDVFFALSGYLITGVILEQCARGTFSLGDFYARRIRRLLPPVIPVTLVSALFAWFFFLPAQLNAVLKSVIGVFFYANNFLFLTEADYFAEASANKPLLHTWSLAIEEQFYLIFPLVLGLAWTRGKAVLRSTVATLFAVSLLASLWAIRADFREQAFFVSPLRFWELLAGALLATLRGFRGSRGRAFAVRFLGFVLISAPLALYTSDTSFPGLTAIPPVLGSCLLFWVGSAGSDPLLAFTTHPLVVYLGKISYGLYLWHWPLLVAAKFLFPANGWALAGSVALGFALAALSFRYLEMPLRTGVLLAGVRRPFQALAASTGVIAGAAMVLLVSNAAEARWSGQRAQMAVYFDWDRAKRSWVQPCGTRGRTSVVCLEPVPGKTNVLIIGDSHAQHLIPGLAAQFPQANLLRATIGGCKPLRASKGGRHDCVQMRRKLFGEFDWKKVDVAIISIRQSKDDTVAATVDSAQWIHEQGVETWVVGSFLEYHPSVPELVASARAWVSVREIRARAQAAIDPDFLRAGAQLARAIPAGVGFIDTHEIFCRAGDCEIFDEQERPLVVDSAHLTPEGARWFVKRWPQLPNEPRD